VKNNDKKKYSRKANFINKSFSKIFKPGTIDGKNTLQSLTVKFVAPSK